MNVLVIGSTGLTGRLCVQKLLAAGHAVTAMARKPEDWFDIPAGVKVVQGDARDAVSLERAVAGQDAVVIAFGPRSLAKGDVQETLMRHLVPLLQKHRIKRVVNLSAWGALDSRKDAPLLFRFVLVTMLRHVYADKERGEVLLLGSDVPFINVRPGQLTNGPETGSVKAGLRAKGIKPIVSRADLAAFMVKQLSDDTWLNQSPLLGT